MIKKFFTRGWVFLVLAFIYIPIFILIIYSFNSGKTIGVWEAFSFKWYGKLGEIKDVIIVGGGSHLKLFDEQINARLVRDANTYVSAYIGARNNAFLIFALKLKFFNI